MKKKLSRSKLVKKLDTVFSIYVRQRDADKYGNCTCVTCDRKFHWKNIQAGHFISRKHYSTRWDERNVRSQCSRCNVFNSGEQYKYSLFLGSDLSDELLQKSRQITKFTDDDLQELILLYQDKIKVLNVV
jgi:hypothetical protein